MSDQIEIATKVLAVIAIALLLFVPSIIGHRRRIATFSSVCIERLGATYGSAHVFLVVVWHHHSWLVAGHHDLGERCKNEECLTTRQPTPASRLRCNRESLARRGCALRQAL